MFAITSVVIIAILSICFAENAKKWVINFRTDTEVSNANFQEVENWITANNGKVADSLNSIEYKVIIAEMDEKIRMQYINNIEMCR